MSTEQLPFQVSTNRPPDTVTTKVSGTFKDAAAEAPDLQPQEEVFLVLRTRVGPVTHDFDSSGDAIKETSLKADLYGVISRAVGEPLLERAKREAKEAAGVHELPGISGGQEDPEDWELPERVKDTASL